MKNSEIPAHIVKQNEDAKAEQTVKLQTDNIIQTGSVITRGESCRIFVTSVIGQVEGHYLSSHGVKTTKYEHVIPLMAAIEENPMIDAVLIIVNTMGGDVEAGLAIAEMIAGLTKPTASLTLGGSHSIGVPIAVAADRSFIVPSATMTLHPVRTNGLVIGVPQSFAYFAKMQDRIVEFITSQSNISEEDLRRLIMCTDSVPTDMGTVIDGAEAVSLGLIDEIGRENKAMAYLKSQVVEACP